MKSSIKRSTGPARAGFFALAALLALAAGAASAASAGSVPSAQSLRDPTRPPAAASPAPAGAAEPVAAAPQLQAVRVGASGALRVAVIDGESVHVGERFHGARVVRIADSEVELERGREREVLRLYAPGPAAGMTRVARAAQGREQGEP